jgi:hypothetical protein
MHAQTHEDHHAHIHTHIHTCTPRTHTDAADEDAQHLGLRYVVPFGQVVHKLVDVDPFGAAQLADDRVELWACDAG